MSAGHSCGAFLKRPMTGRGWWAGTSGAHDLTALRDGALRYLPLATIACFAVTLGILAYVFESWGLSDVLMAGIVLWVVVAFALIIDLFRRGPVRRGGVAFVAALVTLGAPLWGPWGVASPHVDGAATLTACSLSLAVLLAPGWSKAAPRPARAFVAVILTMPLVAWASLALVEISTMVSDKGFARGAIVQASDSALVRGRCCGSERRPWLSAARRLRSAFA